MLAELPKGQRKEIVRAATKLYKSGAQPNLSAASHPTRAQRRQAARALGWRGAKARHHRRDRLRQVQAVVAVDEALGAAKERVERPIRARLKR